MPRARVHWHDVWLGAAITALLFTAGRFLIGLYIGKSGIASGFGAADSDSGEPADVVGSSEAPAPTTRPAGLAQS